MWDELAVAIVIEAVEEYKYRKDNNYPTKDLEWFFNSEWCDLLLSLAVIDGRTILNYLKNR